MRWRYDSRSKRIPEEQKVTNIHKFAQKPPTKQALEMPSGWGLCFWEHKVIDRLARAFYPAILACWNSEEGQRSLVGARPLHLANARPFGRLKAPLGLSLLRCAAQTRACLWQAEQAHHVPGKEKQSVPDGERPVVHIAIVCGLWQGASIQGAPCFCFEKKLEK